jgi:integrase
MLRLGTMYRLEWSMVDEQRMMLDIPGSIMKNGKPFHQPLSPTALSALRLLPNYNDKNGLVFKNQQHPGQPVESNDWWFDRAKRLAKVSNFHWHDIRHDGASKLVRQGVSLQKVGTMLSHRSLVMAWRYSHLEPEQLHNDIGLIRGIASIHSTKTAPTLRAKSQQQQYKAVTA